MSDWQSLPAAFPWPPKNAQVFSAFIPNAVDIRWDDPATIAVGGLPLSTRAGGSITIGGPLTVQTAAEAAVDFTSSPVSPGTVVAIGGVAVTAVGTIPVAGDNTFDGRGSTSAIAASFAAAVNTGSVAGWGVAEADALGSSVQLIALSPGSVGNSISLTCTDPSVLVSGPTFEAGTNPSAVSIGLITLSATLAARSPGGRDFTVGETSFATAASLAAAINDPANYLTGTVVASQNGDIVNLVAADLGAGGNGIVLGANTTALVLSGSTLTGGAGPGCPPVTNGDWSIVGINIYRSDNGQRGPYIRINRYPIGSLGYRDQTDNTLIESEVVLRDGAWLSKGTDPNNPDWIFRTQFAPVVKAVGNGIAANAPSDVVLKVDGVVVPVDNVFGPTGQITLINQPTWDQARERLIPPVLPTATSEVTITYRYNANRVLSDLDRNTQVWYRLTTVALDPTGTSPSGLVETPLGYCDPVSVSQVETVDYIWREAQRRNRWILEQGGERVKVFKRKVSGLPCGCQIDPHTREYAQQPDARCRVCFGVGFVGGYDGPVDIIIVPDEADRRVSQTPNGRRLEHQYEVWTTINPMLTQRDFIVKQTGERYSIGPVRRPAIRGLPLQQHFNIQYLDEQDMRYAVPVDGTADLAWPETRYTNPEDAACGATEDPYPVGFDYQATPMGSDVPKVPEGRQLRGRSPVWANLTYGGKGS